MTVVFYLNIVSPHQLPLAKEVARLVGKDNFIYIYTDKFYADRSKLGWCDEATDLRVEQLNDANRHLLENATILYTGIRCLDLIEKRSAIGKKTFYTSERWFKPIELNLKIPYFLTFHFYFLLPGMLRLLIPSFYRMSRRFVHLAKTNPNFRILPIGVHAQRDFTRLFHLFYPLTTNNILLTTKLTLWGYFVAPSSTPNTNYQPLTTNNSLRILWVGRMIHWKRVDTIIRAVKAMKSNRFSLTLVGNGDRKRSLVCLSDNASNIFFKDPLPIDQIRVEMRNNDVYVLSSNGEEGWGAALNEAMEESMNVLGTYEAGASATMLPNSHKFHAGDWRGLSELLQQISMGQLQRIPIDDWTAAEAAEKLLAL